jgi:hypothetical protein
MASETDAPAHSHLDTADDGPPDPATMFPRPSAGDLDHVTDASVGITDPRTEVATPDGIAAPFADDGAASSTAPPPDRAAP